MTSVNKCVSKVAPKTQLFDAVFAILRGKLCPQKYSEKYSENTVTTANSCGKRGYWGMP
jgi:hypothetical protein